ncbi:MAG: efflux RND transporter periplasmic adaptor subunit [Mariniblastus sp.]|nr:efflux RND transporter periplasmic adaptor subunit [Mariniblastus sp.]
MNMPINDLEKNRTDDSSPPEITLGGAEASDRWLDDIFKLRSDLKFDARNNETNSFVVIEDPVRSKYFQVGSREYHFIALLDGEKSGHEIVQSLNGRLKPGQQPYDEQSARVIFQWLVQSNLVYGEAIDNAKRLSQQADAMKRSKLVGLLNPISFKIPLFNPNSLLTQVQPYVQWWFSTWFAIIWCIVAVYACSLMLSHWDKMGAASAGILSEFSWVWLLGMWFVLKIIHETAHGIACRRYGGEVPEAGVLLLLFTPMAFVNVTSMWRFSNPWHRMVVAAAGMYVELFVSFIALITWTRTSGVVADVSFNIFLMSSVTTILFNANPLMRFDGYFLLSDALGIPNLYTKGTHWFGDRLKSVLFGVPKTANLCPPNELRTVAVYGCLAFFWKISISLSLTIGAGVLFHGAGLILSAVGIGLFFGYPIYRQLRTLFGPQAKHAVNQQRMAVSFGMLLLAGVFLFSILKAPATKSAPAIIQFGDETLIRADADGFISTVLVEDGDEVMKGQRLIVLDNPTLSNEVVELERFAHEALTQSRIYQKQKELSLSLSELEKHKQLREQIREKRLQASGLVIVAPFDGFVFQRGLENQTGSFAKRGDTLLTIAKRDRKEVVVSIDQRDLDSIEGTEGEEMRVVFPGLSVFETTLDRIETKASQTPMHPSLCAHAGGALTVRPITNSGESQDPTVELLSPRFNVFLCLDPISSRQLQSGQRGKAFFSTKRQSLGSYFYLAACDWLESKIELATQTAVF